MEVSFFLNKKSASPQTIKFVAFLDAVKKGKWRSSIEPLRSIYTNEGKAAYKKAKSTHILPCISGSGVFENGHRKTDLVRLNGLILLDFDDIDTSIKDEVYADDYCFAGFESKSGRGLVIVIQIDTKRFDDSFIGAEKYFYDKYGLSADQACKNFNRLRDVTYDPQPFYNDLAKVWDIFPQKKKGRKPKLTSFFHTDSDVEGLVQKIESSRIDLTADYNAWIELAFGLNEEFGERGEDLFVRVSQFHPDFNEVKVRKKYRACTGGTGGGVAHLFYHAKRAGIYVSFPRTENLAYKAKQARKTSRPKGDFISQVVEVDNVDVKEAEQIADQVYNIPIEEFEKESTTPIDIVVDFIGNFDLRFNEISKHLEKDEKPLSDRDIRSFYIDAVSYNKDIKKELFDSYIHSSKIDTFNPVVCFFSNSKPVEGAIQEIADSIQTRTGADQIEVNFRRHFFKKWICGVVATWMQVDVSPLFLVMANPKINTGKTEFFRRLLPDSLLEYYAEHAIIENENFRQLLTQKLLIMADDMQGLDKVSPEFFRSLMSSKSVTTRLPYDRLATTSPRMAGLCGTSNNLDLIYDPRRNRRIVPINAESFDFAKYNGVDKSDLFAEAWEEVQSGYDFRLSDKDIQILQKSTTDFIAEDMEFSLVERYISYNPSGFGTGMTTTDVKVFIESRTNQRLSLRKIGQALSELDYDKKSVRQGGRIVKVWLVDKRE